MCTRSYCTPPRPPRVHARRKRLLSRCCAPPTAPDLKCIRHYRQGKPAITPKLLMLRRCWGRWRCDCHASCAYLYHSRKTTTNSIQECAPMVPCREVPSSPAACHPRRHLPLHRTWPRPRHHRHPRLCDFDPRVLHELCHARSDPGGALYPESRHTQPHPKPKSTETKKKRQHSRTLERLNVACPGDKEAPH